jgi:flagellar biosynthesis protein FlhB
MSEDQDEDSKTEDPSQKRLDEALEKGNVATSKEVGSFFTVLVLAVTVSWFAPSIMIDAKKMLMPFLDNAYSIAVDQKGVGLILYKLSFASFAVIILPLLATMVAAIAAGFLQHGFVLSTEPMKPKLNKISPMAGFKRIVSMRSLVEFIKGIIKIIVISIVAYMAVEPMLGHFKQLPDQSTHDMLIFLASICTKIMVWVAIAMFFIALFDVMYQRWQHTKSLRMTKQEVKEEYKQSEGDPHIKGKLRQLRMERAKNRMMASVPTADVVITNPTHFAVALKYDTTSMQAPVVVAKGQDLVALRIREIAEENKVPVVENPPLARALFSSTEIEQEIPLAHYEAVAKIISYVYGLKGKKPAAPPRRNRP